MVSSAQRATGGSGLRCAGIRRQPGIATSPLVGYDWGLARGGQCLRTARGRRLAPGDALGGYASNDPQQVLSLPQARSFWYQWSMATPRGERALREEGEAFARQMWDTWSPPGCRRRARFVEAAQAFSGRTGLPWCALLPASRSFVGGAALRGGGTALVPGTAPGAADPGAARRRGMPVPTLTALADEHYQRALPAAGAGGRRPFSEA